MAFELFIAKRYLRAKRKHKFISLISILSTGGVAIGVMALVVVIAVMTGAESDFRKRILGVDPHIMLRYHGRLEYTDQIKQTIKKTDGIADAIPYISSQVMIRGRGKVTGAILRGIDPDTTRVLVSGFTPENFKRKLKNTNSPEAGIIIGKEMARGLRVDKGDMIYIISPQGMLSPVGHLPAMRRFKITGVFSTGMYEYDGSLAYIHLNDAQKFFRMGNKVSAIGLWVEDIYKADVVRESLIEELGFPFWAVDWMQKNRSLFSALKLEKTAMFIILILIVIVAAFNIASTLIMMVMEKTKDIAILKAMGATDKSIRKIFVFKGMVIGLIGTSIGIVSGVIMCLVLEQYKFIELPEAYPFSTLPVQLETLDVITIAVSAMVICFLSTLYPAQQASKQNPVEAIRYG